MLWSVWLSAPSKVSTVGMICYWLVVQSSTKLNLSPASTFADCSDFTEMNYFLGFLHSWILMKI